MNKKELRLKYKSLRKSLKQEEVEAFSISVANQLLKIPIWNNTYFHIFLPIEALNELNTEYILHILSGKDKEVVISKSNFATTTMKHFLLTDNTKIIKNEFNIPEPVNSLAVPVIKIEVVFVPLLAFDEIGNRVGYGKGFYDKFLAECNSETIKIGLSFFDAEFEITDVNANDIRLNYCVTPNKVYEF
ncbi:MAG: 5-formyltetrahydrofolate cyclo-ligase [Flavobacterium sp.]|nr:5-formyltetrahydrofolate cyclo-ligase [Flavobacterium sp.]